MESDQHFDVRVLHDAEPRDRSGGRRLQQHLRQHDSLLERRKRHLPHDLGLEGIDPALHDIQDGHANHHGENGQESDGENSCHHQVFQGLSQKVQGDR